MIYVIEELIGNEYRVSEFDCIGIYAGAQNKGYKCIGYTDKNKTKYELRNKPRFDGLIGPMYDGEDRILYADYAAYMRMTDGPPPGEMFVW